MRPAPHRQDPRPNRLGERRPGIHEHDQVGGQVLGEVGQEEGKAIADLMLVVIRFRFTTTIQGNHNPRVGGSSPSAATCFVALLLSVTHARRRRVERETPIRCL